MSQQKRGGFVSGVSQAIVPGRQAIRVAAVSIQPQAQVSDLVAVVDVSGSMDELARGGMKKLPAAIEATIGLAKIKARLDSSGRFGEVAFSDDAKVVLGWTSASDMAAIERATRALCTIGGTSIAAGLRRAKELLQHSKTSTPRYVVLLSDGHANSGDNCLVEAEALKASGVVIYGVGVGANPSDVDTRLPAIASPGKYVFLSDVQDLIAHFQCVGRETSRRANRVQQ
jgi:hypothetical protein